ncbi:MAG: flotillin-like FloA family protein [Planctomycetota bacterium]|jgi:hypothetical protein
MTLQTGDAAKVVMTVVLVIIVLAVLVFFLLFLKFFRLWLQARLACADVKFAELIGMWLRRSDSRSIVLSRMMAVQGGVPLRTVDLESHYLAGGRVAEVVSAMIAAKRGGVELSWKEATAKDLKGDDVLAEVQSTLETREETKTGRPELRYGDVGEAVSEFRPAGQVRFGGTIVDVVSEGGDVRRGAKVEVVRVREDEVVVRPAEAWYER